MKYLFLILILAKCVFIGVPEMQVTPFPFAVGTMVEVSLFTYCWAFIDIAALFAVVLTSWLLVTGRLTITPDITKALTAFMIVCGLDLLDYALRGNSEWFFIGRYPITNNVFMIPAYCIMAWR